MKLIGFPLYAISVVIFSLLLGAGVGSRVSMNLNITPTNRWSWPFVGILAIGFFILASYPYVFDAFLSAPVGGRILVASALIFPLGFFLGMPFPLGILAIQRQPKGAIGWAWGLNGVFTVVGGLSSVLLSVFLGFRVTLLVALALYVFAFLMAYLMMHSGKDSLAIET